MTLNEIELLTIMRDINHSFDSIEFAVWVLVGLALSRLLVEK